MCHNSDDEADKISIDSFTPEDVGDVDVELADWRVRTIFRVHGTCLKVDTPTHCVQARTSDCYVVDNIQFESQTIHHDVSGQEDDAKLVGLGGINVFGPLTLTSKMGHFGVTPVNANEQILDFPGLLSDSDLEDVLVRSPSQCVCMCVC